jgi:hypothetical protein
VTTSLEHAFLANLADSLTHTGGRRVFVHGLWGRPDDYVEQDGSGTTWTVAEVLELYESGIQVEIFEIVYGR